MSKFKVGDKVKCIANNFYGDTHVTVGEEYILQHDGVHFFVKTKNYPHGVFYSESNLYKDFKLVENEKKVKHKKLIHVIYVESGKYNEISFETKIECEKFLSNFVISYGDCSEILHVFYGLKLKIKNNLKLIVDK